MRAVSTEDVLTGNAKFSFTSRPACLAIQSDCADLRRTHAHLSQSTRPSKKSTGVRDLKRYLNYTTIGRDGLLIVKLSEPLAGIRERIVVLRQVLDCLLMALHIQLNHPSCLQLKMVRYFFALDVDKAIEQVSTSCHQCTTLLKTPKTIVESRTVFS